MREYTVGDDPRSVDWNVTARAGKPYVKKYVDERELTVLFLVDVSPSMNGGFSAWSARQTAARLCACLALSAIQNNDKVGMIAFSHTVTRYVPAHKGSGHILRIVRDILALRGDRGETGLREAIQLASTILKRRSVIFLVSDFLAPQYWDALSILARRHDVIAARLLYPEVTPPRRGLTRLVNPETGERHVVDWRNAGERAAYVSAIETWREEAEEGFRRAHVDWMDFPIPRVPGRDCVARPLLEFFRMRELRGARR